MHTFDEFMLEDDDRYGTDTDSVRSHIRNWVDRKNPEYQVNLKNYNIHSLPPLPKNLKNLIIGNNHLIYISKESLPSSLVNFSCTYCEYVKRIPALPNSVLTVNFTGSGISELPLLPVNIQRVIAAETNISEIPYLYSGIQELIISNTNVGKLPYLTLPHTMFELDISNTKIKRLPKLNRGLKILNISNTKISILPQLPFSLAHLYVGLCDKLIINRNSSPTTLENIQSYGERWDEWHRINNEKIRAFNRCRIIKKELIAKAFYNYLKDITA
jgi:hypothetical protein